MKIKLKFMVGLSVILVTLGIILNIIIRQALISNMEEQINNSLKEVMKSTQEHIRYTLIIDSMGFSDDEENGYGLNEDGLKMASASIAKNININYNCTSRISSMNGDTIKNSIKDSFKAYILNSIKAAKNGKAVIDIKYKDNGVNGILSYPVYENDNYIGIITICKDYDQLYQDNSKIINFITGIEFAIFISIFILAFFMTSRITYPISKLTEAAKEIAKGDYDYKIECKTNDEMGILSREFINMKDKIKEQITTIEKEKDKVEKLEKVRKKFFDNVTHELKTPLTGISGYAEMLSEGMVEDKEFKERAVKRIYSESERLHKLVLKLIDVSKGDSFVDEVLRPINMGELLNEICDDMNIKAKKYSRSIVRNVNGGSILGQPNKIRELIINIIDNAIKYSIDDKIYIRDMVEDNYYKLEVENKSKPIPDNIYKRIFEPFVKTEKSIEKQSSGLGLYICDEIVKEHNGEIKVENGEKIVVKVKIPALETSW